MTKYTVIWKKEIEADSPEQAVNEALHILKPCYMGGDANTRTGQEFQVDWTSHQSRMVKTRSMNG